MKREMIRGSFVGMLLWFALIAIVAPFVLSRTSPLWMLPGMVLAVVANFGYMAHVLRRNLARLEACSWHRCCWCEYDTTPIGDSGTCPECGREFSTSLLKADFQGLMDQLVWWMPKRWRTTFSGDAAGNATIDHAPLRAPQPGAKDYVDRSSTTSIGIGIIGSIVGFIGSGVIARLLQLKVGHSVFAILGVLAVAMLVNVAFQMPYLLYRRGRLSRRDWNICPW